jgi:hypothetical protein
MQFFYNFLIIRFAGLIAIGATIQIYGSAGLPFAQIMFDDCILDQLTLLFWF